MRSALVTAVVVALVSACGSEPASRMPRDQDAVTVSAAPAAPLGLSFTELVEALPSASDLYPWTVTVRCLTMKAECGHYLDGKGALVVAAGRSNHDVPERLMLGTLRWPDGEAAEHALARLRTAETDQFQGHFDRGPRSTSSTSYVLGERGHGAVDDLAVAGWSGFRRTARFRYVHRGGETTRAVEWVSVVLGRGGYKVYLQISRFRAGHRAAREGELLLTELLSRLEQAGAEEAKSREGARP
jgi:hypothetical protein